ncbi:Signal peptidase I W [Candidatus Izimaplasma bacterium HR1]|jgi:signal peptidase|uniref:signal peptidase I n=1 Tax=Candidatus Izimoplasma sp. HR1 TaxID=1541959 RepID=UPI0004F67C4A|nr:Signal peptidase I W [Candidatus Izimaplasma bacterium HR1]
MKNIKLKKGTIETLKFIGLLIIIFVILNLIFTFIPPFSKMNLFAVQTDSMSPVISPGDIIVTKEIDPEDIEVGDIMAFRVDITSDGIDDVVVHYIDEINTYEGELIFKSKPHVSDIQDRWTIEEEDLVGIYKYQIKSLGKVLLFAQSWIGRIIILVDVIIISVIYDVLFGKKKSNEENINDTNEDKEKTSVE